MRKLTKKSVSLISLLALLLISATWIWHGSSLGKASQEDAHEHTSNKIYICPMHPQVRESAAGRCPICGMDLVATEETPSASKKISEPSHQEIEPVYVCPMHPQVREASAGRCPICGMDLVKTQGQQSPANDAADHAHTEQVIETNPPPNAQVTPVEKRRLSAQTKAWGRLVLDGTNEFVVTAPADGWIRKLYVDHVGQNVAVGEALFEIFSPELYQRQREYIDTLNRRDQLARAVVDMGGQNAEVLGSLARERKRQRDAFFRIGIANSSMDTLEKYHRPLETLAVASPYAGKVLAIDARQGLAAGPGTTLYRITSDGALQINVVLTPTQMAHIHAPARLMLAGGTEDSAVDFDVTQAAYDSALQSYVVRVALPKAALASTPFASWQNHTPPQGAVLDVVVLAEAREVLAVPRRAILDSPEGQFVVVEADHQRYAVRKVTVGALDTHWAEISAGVALNDKVVTEGQFLLDAAATFQQSFSQ